jgi:hypothetical protein
MPSTEAEATAKKHNPFSDFHNEANLQCGLLENIVKYYYICWTV